MKKNSSTFFAHAARTPADQYGFVNMPPVRGSTVEFESLEAMDNRSARYGYGRTGNPSSDALQDLVTQMEGGAATRLTPSGIEAISVALLSVCEAGKKVLIVDCCYEPTRFFADRVLARMGVQPVYFDPYDIAAFAQLVDEDVCAILLESPGSLTLELQDIPGTAATRGDKIIPIIVDNTWASPLFYQPLELGADIVVHSATKYFSGHSDVSLGTITANENWSEAVTTTCRTIGTCASPDDIFLVLRGMKTLRSRMDSHSRKTIELANWLSEQPEVLDVLHPALASHRDNALFVRDFSGSGSVFTFELNEAPRTAVAAMLDNFKYFAMGYSYGGFESLVLAPQPATARSASDYSREGNLVRLHVGAEDLADLKDDLSEGLKRYEAARKSS